jgi:SAM-dependent methyltransferase
MKNEEYQTMFKNEHDLWWYKALHSISMNNIEEIFGKKYSLDILDAGCGTGGLIKKLILFGYDSSKINGFDISEIAVNLCLNYNLNVIQGDLNRISRVVNAFEQTQYDVIVCNDALYYINPNEQQQFISEVKDLLKPGGILIMNLPAYRVFSGSHDIAVGLKKRFTPNDILKLISARDYKIIKLIKWPFLLFPFILMIRNIQKIKIKINLNKEIKSDVKMPAKFLNNLLWKLCQFEFKIPLAKPFGSSIFIVLQRNKII